MELIDSSSPMGVIGSGTQGGLNAPIEFTPTASNPIRVNFSDPFRTPTASAGGFNSTDVFQLDADPYGTRTVEYGKRVGKPYANTDVLSLNVFGREMGYEQLNESEAGRRLLDIAKRNREGRKLSFWDTINPFDRTWSWGASDIPFVSLVASVGKSIKDAVDVSDTFKKLQNGEQVSDDELIKARLSMAENEYRANGSIGSKIGDIVRAAPGFMAEFFASGGLYSAARTGVAALAKGSTNWTAHIALSRMTKLATDELAERFVSKATKETLDSSKDLWLTLISKNILGNVKEDLGKHVSADLAEEVAKKRASIAMERAILKHTTEGSVAKWWVGAKRSLADHASRALLDFGTFGAPFSTLSRAAQGSAMYHLGDAINTFLVEAPIRGALIMAPQRFLVNPVLSMAFGKDGRTVSQSELSLQEAAMRSGNKQLMSDAHAIGFGLSFLEYASESSGRGFDALFKAAGTKLLAAKTIGRTVLDGTMDTTEGIISREKMREAGSWFRRWIHKTVGAGPDVEQGLLENQRVAMRAAFATAEDKALKSGRSFTPVADDAFEAFRINKDVSRLASPEAARLVEEAGGFDQFLEQSMKDAIRRREVGVTFKRFGQYVVADKMVRHGWTPDKAIDWLQSAGYDGLVQEMLEERYSDFASGLFGLDERAGDEKGVIKNISQAFKNLWPGWDQLVAEAVGFSVPMGVRMAVHHIQRSAGGGELTKLQYWAEQLRDLHAGKFVQTKTNAWFEEIDERIRDLEGKVSSATDAEEKNRASVALSNTRAQRARVLDSIGGAAQAISEKVRWLEAVDTQTDTEEAARRREGYTAQTSARAGAIYEFLVNNVADIGRTLDDLQTAAPGEHVSFWNRIAGRVAGIAGAIVTGDLSLAQMNPAAWSAVDRGFDEEFVNELTALSRTFDAKARDAILAELGATASGFKAEEETLSADKTAHEAAVAKLNDDARVVNKADSKEVEELRRREDELAVQAGKLAEREQDLLRRKEAQQVVLAENAGLSKDKIRARSSADYTASAKAYMRSWLSLQNIKTFQQSEMRDIAVRHVAAKYGFVDGQERVVNGQTVSTIDDFVKAVPDEVNQMQDEIARATLHLVANRNLAETDDRGRTFLNIDVGNPLYSDALLGAALEQAGFSDTFEVNELKDGVSLESVVARRRVPVALVQAVAGLSASVASGGELSDDQRAQISSLAKLWGFAPREYTASAISEMYSAVTDLAAKAYDLFYTTDRLWSKNVGASWNSDPTGSAPKDVVRATRLENGDYAWRIEGKDYSGTEDQMVQSLQDNGYRPMAPTITFGRTRIFSSRNAALLIDKMGMADRVVRRQGGVTGDNVDPRFRVVVNSRTDGSKQFVRMYTPQEADDKRIEEAKSANRWARLALSSAGEELDEEAARKNYLADGVADADVKEAMAADKAMYAVVYGTVERPGYIRAMHQFLQEIKAKSVPSLGECQERGGVLENPYKTFGARYEVIPSSVTPQGTADTYVFLDFKRNRHVSYEAALANKVFTNAVLSNARQIMGRKGGTGERGIMGTVLHSFYKRALETIDRLENESIDAGRHSEAEEMQELADILGAGVGKDQINTSGLVSLLSNVIGAQLERDVEEGRVRATSNSAWMRLVKAMRRTPEYIPAVVVTDMMLGGTSLFALGGKVDEKAPPTGLFKFIRTMSGANRYKFLSQITPPGMQSKQFRDALAKAAEVFSGNPQVPELQDGDLEFIKWARGLSAQFGCKDLNGFVDVIDTLISHSGLYKNTTELKDWVHTLARQKTAKRLADSKAAELKKENLRLKNRVAELKKERDAKVEELKKAQEKLASMKGGDAGKSEIETAEAAVKEKEAEVVKANADAAAAEDAADDAAETLKDENNPGPEDPGPEDHEVDAADGSEITPTGEEFDPVDGSGEFAAPADGRQEDPEEVRRVTLDIEADVDPDLSDLSDDPNKDEVGAAACSVMPLVAVLHDGKLTDENIDDVIRRFFRVHSNADDKAIAERVKKSLRKFVGSGDLTFADTINAAAASGGAVNALGALHDFLSKDTDGGIRTKDNEQFADKALSAFKALDPFVRVLTSVCPEIGKSGIQGFMTRSREALDTRIEEINAALSEETDADNILRYKTQLNWLDNARLLLRPRGTELGGDSFSQRCAAHAAFVRAFTDGTDSANQALFGLISSLASDIDGRGPLDAGLAVFFSYIASLPVGVRAGVLTLTAGIMQADTVRVQLAHDVIKVQADGGESRYETVESWSVEQNDAPPGHMMADAWASAFFGLLRDHTADEVRKIQEDFIRALSKIANEDKDSGRQRFVPMPSFVDENRPSKREARNAMDRFRKNAGVMAGLLDGVAGRGNSLSSVLKSKTLLAHMEELAASDDEGDRYTLCNTIASFCRDDSRYGEKTRRVPFAMRAISALLMRVSVNAKLAGREKVDLDEFRRLAMATLNNGNIDTARSDFESNTSMRTDRWVTLFNMYNAAMPVTTVKSDVVEGRTFSSVHPSIAVSLRGQIPVITRWMTVESDGSFSFRVLAMEYLRAELARTYSDLDTKKVTKEKYIEDEIKKLGGEDAIIAECQRTLTWPGRRHLAIIARNTAIDYRDDEITKALAEQFKAYSGRKVWYVKLYAGDHSGCNLVQIPVMPKAAYKKDGVTLRGYKKVVKAVNDALGVSRMGNSAKRSAISNADAEQFPMAGCTMDLSHDADTGVPRPGAPKFGECRMAVLLNPGYDHKYTVTDNNGNTQEVEVEYTNEEAKGTMVACGFAPEMFRATATNPNLLTEKLHYIAHGEMLEFYKAATSVVGPGENGNPFEPGTMAWAMAEHVLSYYTADEFRRNSMSFTDEDSVKVEEASSMSKQGVGVLLPDGKHVGIRTYVMQKLKETGKLAGLREMDAAAIDEMVGPFTWENKVAGIAPTPNMTASQILGPGLMLKKVENIYGDHDGTRPAFAFSYSSNQLMAIKAANIAHTSDLEQKRSNKNYVKDLLTTAVGQFDGTAVDGSNTAQEQLVDTVTTSALLCATIATDEDSVNLDIRTSPSIRRENRIGTDSGCITYINKKSDIAASRLRKAVLPPVSKIDASLVTVGCFETTLGKDNEFHSADHTESPMKRACHVGSYVVADDDVGFYGENLSVKLRKTLRFLGQAEVNISHPGFRYNWFLSDANGVSKLYDDLVADDAEFKYVVNEALASGSQDRLVIMKLEAVFRILRDAEASEGEEAKSRATSIRARIGNLFVDHYGLPIGDKALTTCFEDLFTYDGGNGRCFDRTAFKIEGRRIPLTKYKKGPNSAGTGRPSFVREDSEPMICMEGSLTFDPRTPSYDGANYHQVVRASFPLSNGNDKTYDDKGYVNHWSVGADAWVGLDCQSLRILGNDNDGDEGAVMCYTMRKRGGAIPFATGVPAIWDALSGVTDKKEALKTLRMMNTDGTMVTGTYVDKKGRERKKIGNLVAYTDGLDKNGNRIGGAGYRLTDTGRAAFGNSFIQAVFDMARQFAVPRGVNGQEGQYRPFCGKPEAEGAEVYDGNESRRCQASVTNNPDIMKAFAAEETPPSVLDLPGATMGELSVQEEAARSANDASEARAGFVNLSDILHTAYLSGMFFRKTGSVTGRGGLSRLAVNRYALFDTSDMDRATFVSMMSHFAGLANMSFDDLKEQMCGRLCLTNISMVNVLAADLLTTGNTVDAGAGFVGKIPTVDSDYLKKNEDGTWSGRFAEYVKSASPFEKTDGEWKRRKVPRAQMSKDEPGDWCPTDIDKDYTRLYMNLASNSHTEDEAFRKAISMALFKGASSIGERMENLMSALGISCAKTEKGYLWSVRKDLKPDSGKYALASILAARFNHVRLAGASGQEILRRCCTGSVTDGFDVAAGYMAWLAAAASGSLQTVNDNYKGRSVKNYAEIETKLRGHVARFLTFMNKSGVLLTLKSFDRAISFQQVNPGAPSAKRNARESAEAYERVVEEAKKYHIDPFRLRAVERMREATTATLSGTLFSEANSNARVTIAREALINAADLEEADRTDDNRVNGRLVEFAANNKNEAMADLMAELNLYFEEAGASDATLVSRSIRSMGESALHAMFVPAAAQVLSTAGASYIGSTSDVFRMSECLARAASVTPKAYTKGALPSIPEVLYFRRAVEAVFEVVFNMASTSEEGQNNSALNYLFSVVERAGKYGYNSNGQKDSPYKSRIADDKVSNNLFTPPGGGGNALRTIRQLFSVATQGNLSSMQDAFRRLINGELDGDIRTDAYKGTGDIDRLENHRSVEIRRQSGSHLLTWANVDAAFKNGTKSQTTASIAVVKNLFVEIARWKNPGLSGEDLMAEAKKVILKPSDLGKFFLPWYTIVQDPVQGSPSFDAFSNSMVNCFPGFWQALSQQQALNDRLFRDYAARATKGSDAIVIPYTDLAAAVNNAPVNWTRSIHQTRKKLAAETSRLTGKKHPVISEDLAVKEIKRKLAGEPTQFGTVVRDNPRSRNLFDIFHDNLFERITTVYNGFAGASVDGAKDMITAEYERQRAAYHELAERQKTRNRAKADATPVVQFAESTSRLAKTEDMRRWTLDTLSTLYPEFGTAEDPWSVFVAKFPNYEKTVAKWKRAGVPDSLCSDHDYIMHRFAWQSNIRALKHEHGGMFAGYENKGADYYGLRTIASGPQNEGDGSLKSLFGRHKSVFVFDTETNGGVDLGGDVVQLAGVLLTMNGDGTVTETPYNWYVRQKDGKSMSATFTKRIGGNDVTRSFAEHTGITDEKLKSEGLAAAEVARAFSDLVSGGALLVSHNVLFDSAMLYKLLDENGLASALDDCDFLDTLTVFRDRAAAQDNAGRKVVVQTKDASGRVVNEEGPHSLSRMRIKYGVSETNTHGALDDARTLLACLRRMEVQRDDLARYENIVSFSKFYGIASTVKAPTVHAGLSLVPTTIVKNPAAEDNGMVAVSDTAYAGIPTMDLTPPTDTPEPPDHKKVKTSEKTKRFADRLGATLKALEVRGADTQVRVEGNTIVVTRNVVGEAFRKRMGHDVRTVVRIDVGKWAPSGQTDSSGKAIAIDLNNPAVARSVLAAMAKKDVAYRRLTVEQFLEKTPMDVRIALVRRCLGEHFLHEGMLGVTGHAPSWCIDSSGLRTLCAGIRLNEANADEKTLFHEYFHASMSMLIAMGAISEEDCRKLGKSFKPTSRINPNDPRSWYNEETLAYAFGEYAYNVSRNPGAAKADRKSETNVFLKLLNALKAVLEGLAEVVLPNGFSYDDTAIDGVKDQTGVDMGADKLLFNVILTGAVVESRDTSGSAAVERLSEATKVAQAAMLEESAMAHTPELRATNYSDRYSAFGKAEFPNETKRDTQNGRTMVFSGENGDHTYAEITPNGSVSYTPVSDFIALHRRPFDPEAAVRAMDSKRKGAKYPGLSDRQIMDLWEEEGKTASRLGTRVHAVLESVFNGTKAPDPVSEEESRMFETARKTAESIKAGTSKLGKVRIVGSEKLLWTPAFRVAGMADMIAVSEDGKTVYLVDHKTNRDLDKPEGSFFGQMKDIDPTVFGGYTMQLNLYRKMIEDSGMFDKGVTIKMVINHIGHDGSQEFREVPIEGQTVRLALMHAKSNWSRFRSADNVIQDVDVQTFGLIDAIDDPDTPDREIVAMLIDNAAAAGYSGHATMEDPGAQDPGYFGAIDDPSTLTSTQEITADFAADLGSKVAPGDDIMADAPQTMDEHVRMSRALTTLVHRGMSGLTKEMREYLEGAPSSVLSGKVENVINLALHQLAMVMGDKMPKGDERKLLFRAARIAYNNFHGYAFNSTKQNDIRLAREHSRDHQRRRENISRFGLTAGILVQSGVSYQDIANNTLSQIHDMYVAEKSKTSPDPRMIMTLRHFEQVVTDLANNNRYAKYAFAEISAGFITPQFNRVDGMSRFVPADAPTVKKEWPGKDKIVQRNLAWYPYQSADGGENKDFTRAINTTLRGMYLMVAARNYAMMMDGFIKNLGDRDITASLGRTVALARRNFNLPDGEASPLDALSAEELRRRREILEPLSKEETLGLCGMTAEQLADEMFTANPTETVGFMMAEPNGWLLSTLRPRFHGKNLREMAQGEHNAMAGILYKLRDRANWWIRLLGLDQPAGSAMLAVHEEDRNFSLKNGRVVYDEGPDGEKRMAFHARQRRAFGVGKLRGNVTDILLDDLDREEIDWILKAINAYESGEQYVYTALDKLRFSSKDLLNEDGSARVYAADYFSPENVRKRHDEIGPGNVASNVDTKLYRMIGRLNEDGSATHGQVPDRILYGDRTDGSGFGFYRQFTDALVATLNHQAQAYANFTKFRTEVRAMLADPKTAKMSPEVMSLWLNNRDLNPDGVFDVSHEVLSELEHRGVVVCHRETRRMRNVYHKSEGAPEISVATSGCIAMPVEALRGHWERSISYKKICQARSNLDGKDGRHDIKQLLTFDAIGSGAMRSYHEARDFAKKNLWMFEGDGSLLNCMGSHVPFMSGSGAFKWMSERVGRDRIRENTERLSKAEASFKASLNSDLSKTTSEQWGLLFDQFNVKEDDISSFKRAVWNGEYAAGTAKSAATGLVLSAEDAASGYKVAAVIYSRIHALAFGEIEADENMIRKMGGRAGLMNMIDMYDQAASTSASLLKGSGLNADQMYREHGVLPANMQIFHHVESVVSELARTIQFRNTLAGFLTSKDVNGRPIAYARPSSASDPEHCDGIPEALWKELALWWTEANPELNLKYDDSISGRANAIRLYDAIMKSNGGRVGGRKFGELDGKYLNGVRSISQFAALDDTDDSDHSSIRNRLNGGEAIGYAKQLFSIPRMIGGDFQGRALQRISAWSKTLSVQCSLFFPIATRFESAIAATGFWSTICSNTNPRLAEKFGKAMEVFDKTFGTSVGAAMNRNFIGMQDIMDMMDSDDPFLEDCRDICAALGITLSDRSVNPAEGDKSYVEGDVRRLVRAARATLGDTAAENLQNVLNGFLFRGSERAFTYVLNATKMATALQIAERLRVEAEKQGRHFDIVQDLKPYAAYINAEIGGIDPMRYAWANKKFLKCMNIAMFSWEWTKGAWSAGGGEILEDMLFGGHNTNNRERQIMVGRWLRMYGEVMIGVPMTGQVVCKLLGKLLGWDSDDDKWMTANNEEKIGMSAFDITPLLRGLALHDWWAKDLKGLPLIGNLIPAYTGEDAYNTSKNRRYYMHFGKQGWEFFRWFTHPWEQAMSKLSMPTQRIIEGLAGYNPSNREYNLPFSNMTLMERWVNPTTDGALFNLMKAFIPFSFNAFSSYGDAGFLPVLGPIKMGTSRRKVINDLKAALSAWASNDRTGGGYSFGGASRSGWRRNITLVDNILMDARRNGIDPEAALREAVGQVQTKYYRTIFEELPKALNDGFDETRLRRAARALNRLGTKLRNAYKALKTNAKNTGIDWDRAPNEYKLLRKRTLKDALANPFSIKDTPEQTTARLGLAAAIKGGRSYDY